MTDPTHFTWVFVGVVFVAAVVVFIGIELNRITREDKAQARYAAMERHPSSTRCGMRSEHGSPCTYPRTEWVVDNTTNQAVRVCGGHKNEGDVLGWWTVEVVYDQEATYCSQGCGRPSVGERLLGLTSAGDEIVELVCERHLHSDGVQSS